MPLARIDLQNVPSAVKKSLEAQAGAHVVLTDKPMLTPYLSRYIAHRLAGGEGLQGIPFPALPTNVLMGGSQRALNEAARLASKFRLTSTEQPQALQRIAELPLELHDHATLEVLRPYVAANTHVVVQHGGSSDLPRARETVVRLDRLAFDVGAHIILIGAFADRKSKSLQPHIAAETLHADHAEEDPHCLIAWSMGSDALGYRNCFGNGRRLIQVKADAGGLHFEEEPFVSNKVIDRVVYKCHRSNLTLVDIGVIVGRDKGTISRILQTLPKPREANLPDDWWEAYQKTFNFTEEILAKLEKSRS